MQKLLSGEKTKWLAGNHARAKVQKGKDAVAMARGCTFQAATQNGTVIKLAEDPLTRLAVVNVTKVSLVQDAKSSLSEVTVDLLDMGTLVQPTDYITIYTMLENSFTIDIQKAKLKYMPFSA